MMKKHKRPALRIRVTIFAAVLGLLLTMFAGCAKEKPEQTAPGEGTSVPASTMPSTAPTTAQTTEPTAEPVTEPTAATDYRACYRTTYGTFSGSRRQQHSRRYLRV